MVEQLTRTGVQTADLLRDLVSIPSPSRSESAAVRWLCDQMSALGYQAHADGAGNAVGTRGDGVYEIMLLGHIDTVPGEISVEIVDGALYGRGTVDAKGPLATFVVAGARATLPPNVRLTVVGAVEEEVMSSRGAHWLIDNVPAPSIVVIGEPSGWDSVVIGYKGSIRIDYQAEVPTSHSAGPEPTASELVVGFWNRLCDWCAGHNHDLAPGFASVDATLISINSTNDGLADRATLHAGLRLPLTVDPDTAVAALNELAHCGTVETTVNAAAFRSDKRSPLVGAFISAIRAESGAPRIKVKTGTSDMNLVGPVWNCPIVAYGPGDSRLDHQPNEHVMVQDLERATNILVAAIERVATQLVNGRFGGGA